MAWVRATSVISLQNLVIWFTCAAAGEACGAESPANPSNDAQLSEVVITGSRIPTEPTAGTTPLTVLNQDDLRRGGLDTLGRVLQTLPASAGAPMNTNVNDGGDGSERVDLRGLGPGRTLVLLNGRRFPNGGLGGDDSVDLGMIPLSLVERVEVMTSGASAIYGADAIAGVVNVITRSAAPGGELALKGSVSGQGDGNITTAHLVLGRAFGAGDWSIGADYLDQQPVMFTDRSFSSYPVHIVDVDGTREVGGTPAIPDGFFRVPDGNLLKLDPGPYVRIPGALGQSAADYRKRVKTDVFVLAPYVYLQTPTQHGSLWLLGSQPLSESVTLFIEGLWNRRDSTQRTAPTPIISGLSPLPSLGDGTYGIPAGNWYNPFGVDIVKVNRRLIELPDRSFNQHIDAWRALVGARGGWGQWHWEVAAASAGSNSQSTENGLPSSLRLIPALGPSGPDAQGHIVCGARDSSTGIVPAAHIIAGCVPLNLFGGAGSITPAQVNYINTVLHDQGSGSNQLLDFSAEGPWGALPAGPMRWSLGAEYRREAGSYQLDPLRRAGVTGEDIPTEISGADYQTRELYLEGRAPLLKDKIAARSLDLSVGLRYSDYSSFGSNTTGQAGLRWQPVEDWSMRASYAQVFRAPNLRELYASQFPILTQGPDPCGNPTPAQRAHCAANGVPGGAYVQDPAAEWGLLYGGNPQLAPERGTSFDVGVDLRPRRMAGLRASVDYFRVELNEFIEAPSANDILLECANRGTPDICALIHRNSDGSLQQVDALQRNLGRTVASGYDGALNYTFAVGGNQLSLGTLVSYLAQRDYALIQGEMPRHLAGSQGFPHWRGNAHLDATRGRWRVGYSLQYIGVQTQCLGELGDPPQTACFPIGSVLYHDLEAAINLRPGFRLSTGVLNLTNVDPPYIDVGGPNTDVGTYRLLGRSYYAALE